MFAITDLVNPENEEVIKTVGIELFSDDSFTDRSYRTPGDSEQFCHRGLIHLGTCPSYQVFEVPRKPRLPNWSGKWYCLSDHPVGWTPESSQLAREPRLVNPDVEVSPSGVERSRVITGPGRIGALRAYQPRSGKPELYQQFVWTN
ncbi:hypothetical protein FEAC_10330 [Ferrimicrobium acidiphilum DSM 19497]|uniref:Uncharacterized protein n=1 Tax=Ferrimicrobium acidiphilum DSM 19497 TaxID=1121877 RepID=A0A0D8FVK5_9ACTN|nr:hypothetical protein FEAC_10330 [Ferrimicrobium acidiphilum DSM 19497]